MKAGQEETSRKLARSGRKASYTFKRKANEIQHRFNGDMADKLNEAEAAVAKVEPTAEGRMKEVLGKIKEALAEGRQLIAHRQKLLKLADRSEHRWSVVDEYEEDRLANDSEDEKRIEKAERAAERRVQAKRRKEAVADGGKRAPHTREAAQQELPRPRPEERPYKPTFAPGICFQCGGMEHLRRDCPPLSAEYPLLEY